MNNKYVTSDRWDDLSHRPSPQPSPAIAGEGAHPLAPLAGRGLGRGEDYSIISVIGAVPGAPL